MKTAEGSSAHMMAMDNRTGCPVILLDMDGCFFDWGSALNRILLQLDPEYPIVPVGEQLDYDHLCGPGGDRELLLRAGLGRCIRGLRGTAAEIE